MLSRILRQFVQKETNESMIISTDVCADDNSSCLDDA